MKCTLCSKQIPEFEMTSRKDIFETLGVGDADDSPIDNLFRSMGSATQAWKCNRCGKWICNACVCNIVIKQGGNQQNVGQIEHLGCGGMFKAPS